MKEIVHINIGRDFARNLGPQYRWLGEKSGEEFLQDVLRPAFLKTKLVVIDLDDIETYTASFFEGSFGELTREHGLAAVNNKVRLFSVRRGFLIAKINAWMQEDGP